MIYRVIKIQNNYNLPGKVVGGVGEEGEEQHQVFVEIFGSRAQGRHHMVENRQIWHGHFPSFGLQLQLQGDVPSVTYVEYHDCSGRIVKCYVNATFYQTQIIFRSQSDADFGLQRSRTNASSPSSCSP